MAHPATNLTMRNPPSGENRPLPRRAAPDARLQILPRGNVAASPSTGKSFCVFREATREGQVNPRGVLPWTPTHRPCTFDLDRGGDASMKKTAAKANRLDLIFR